MKNMYKVSLQRSDLIELEVHLAKALRGLISFTSHSLYFPAPQRAKNEAEWISRERTLLLPLWWKEEFLGVFMARGVDRASVKRLLPSFTAITQLCLEHIVSIKQSRTDELTGLARMNRLFMRMEQDADMALLHFDVLNAPSSSEITPHQAPLYKACIGLIVLRCPALPSLAVEFGHVFAHEALSAWTSALQKDLPQEILAARSGEYECTLLVPMATRTSCHKLMEEIMARVEEVTLEHAQSKRIIRLHSVAGYALYPLDMEHRRLALPMMEQNFHLLHKARVAVEMAYERSLHLPLEEKVDIHGRYLAYGHLLAQGGIVREILPEGAVVTNLGRHVGAQEGQRFSLWGFYQGQIKRKGELVLTSVGYAQALAEVLQHEDPTWLIQVGDFLHLSTDSQEITLPQKNMNALAGEVFVSSAKKSIPLLSHGEFLRRLPLESEACAFFALAIIRWQGPNAFEHTGVTALEEAMDAATESTHFAMDKVAELCLENLHDSSQKYMPTLCGRYGESSLVFFHGSQSAKELHEKYVCLVEKAENVKMSLAVGLASYPFLQSSKGDILDHCRKALDLALLLPKPQVGLMGSLALNISADQHYSRGYVFGAVEEYKLSLLADATNAMAWNSLGVCMAALSRPHEAQNYFKEALKLWKKAPPSEQSNSEFAATLYNLGTVCQGLAEKRSAARYFRQCIEADTKHYFAHIRLGQLAEDGRRYTQARQYYAVAAKLEDQNKGYGGMARRHLAKVALKQRKNAEARELLHEALLRNPQDASALSMLADIYLQSGEDPAMSEMLARKSLGLRPNHAPTWKVLALALRSMGQEDAALRAEDRAFIQ